MKNEPQKTQESRNGKDYEERTKRRQAAFLKVYSSGASVREATKAAETTRKAIYGWIKDDRNGFAKLYDEAQADFKDSLIERAMSRLKDQKSSDSPILLITMLNAYIPEKFRPNVIPTEEVAKETMTELRNLSKKAFKTTPAERETPMESKSPLQQVEDILLAKKGGKDEPDD
jgi:tRNA A37 methylthiotransferase MiaB